MTEPVIVDRRFNGPQDSAQGGYACGRFASVARQWLGPEQVVVTLHEPPPLGVPIRAEPSGGRVHFWHRELLIASVSRSRSAIVAPEFLPLSAVALGEQAYVTFERHPFASCFVCGPGRPDGLALAPGRIAPGMTGCRWIPDASLADGRFDSGRFNGGRFSSGPSDSGAGIGIPVEFAWAALDCPGGWTVDLAAAPMVLSRLSAEILDLPVSNTEYVVIGRCDAYDAHALTTTTALYRSDGLLTAKAVATWVRIHAGDS